MILGDKIWEMSQTDFFINAIMGIFILLFSIFMINFETHNLAKRQKIDFRESWLSRLASCISLCYIQSEKRGYGIL